MLSIFWEIFIPFAITLSLISSLDMFLVFLKECKYIEKEKYLEIYIEDDLKKIRVNIE